jgi:hypothetical protein
MFQLDNLISFLFYSDNETVVFGLLLYSLDYLPFFLVCCQL